MATEILGLGFAPLGFVPLGFGAPATADQIPRGNSPYSFIDPSTGDFTSTLTPGILDAMTKNSQRVLLALMTEQGSSTALPDFGNAANKLGKIDETFDGQLKDRIYTALTQLTSVEKVITVTSIIINEISPGHINYSVFFYDLEREEADFITLQRIN